MATKTLFLGLNGTLIETPPGARVERIEALALTRDVVPALRRFRGAGYELVVVTNQPGLGGDAYPRPAFDAVLRFLTRLFETQGVEFARVAVCPHEPAAGCGCRKPGVGLVTDLIRGAALDRERSAVIGADESDLRLAENLGLPGYRLGADRLQWLQIAHRLLDAPRTAELTRRTRETDISVCVDLDREADADVATGIGFFDHMLEQLGKHGGFALSVHCHGDLGVDEHHTVEDVALSLGAALKQAIGDKRGMRRYGFVLPMDETVAEVALDLGGRPYLVFEGEFPRERVGGLPTELVPHFFRSLSDSLGATLQIRVRGENAHHMVEACFKGVARALRDALRRSGEILPSTKGTL
jgi:imidazoleglycerol-phosphate dehydratase/histidinol-phosphatase